MKGNKEENFITRKGSDDKEYRIPVGIINGAEPGSQITIYGGEHGTEYDGIELNEILCEPFYQSGMIRVIS